MNNLELLERQLAKVRRPVDLGEFADELKGNVYECWVNAPHIIELVQQEGTGAMDYAVRRKVVAILFDFPLEKVERLDDAVMLWLYAEGLTQYNVFHDSMKKKLSPASTPTSTPPATPTP